MRNPTYFELQKVKAEALKPKDQPIRVLHWQCLLVSSRALSAVLRAGSEHGMETNSLLPRAQCLDKPWDKSFTRVSVAAAEYWNRDFSSPRVGTDLTRASLHHHAGNMRPLMSASVSIEMYPLLAIFSCLIVRRLV